MINKELGEEYQKTKCPTVGHKYHLSWANAGCVWILEHIDIDNIHCFLKTPKTKKVIRVKLADLRLLKVNAFNYKPN